MRNSMLHFRIALFTAVFCASFIATLGVGLRLHPVQPASSDVVLRLHVVPPGQAI